MSFATPVPVSRGRPPRSLRRSRVLGLATALAAALAAACSPPAVVDPDPECQDGQERDCYDGPDGTFGVGSCRAGVQVCVDGEWGECTGSVTPAEETCNEVDDDCDGEVDEGVTNACGGCGELDQIPGDACGSCGTWTCADLDAVDCVGDREPSSETCLADNGCDGAWSCEETGLVTCLAVQVRNQCDVCGGPDLPDLGGSCTTDDGCEGTWVCGEGGTGLVCDGPSRNACGICGGAAVQGLGETCLAGNGCDGTRTCDEAGTGTVCVAQVEKNPCGLCGGPDLPDLGTACSVEGCPATWICNESGDALVCNSTGKNNCGACDAPDVLNIGGDCLDGDFCEGKWDCDAEGTGATCLAEHPLNECHLCGPPVDGVGADCTDDFHCPGTAVCDAEGTGTTCSVIGRPPDVGNNCFTESGCPGIVFCDGEDGVTCVEEGPCERTQHVVISELAVGREGGAAVKNQFIELYNPTDQPYDLTQLEIWINTGSSAPPAVPYPGDGPLCIACSETDTTTSCDPDVNSRWAPGCIGTAIIQPRSYFLLGRDTGYVAGEGEPEPDARFSVRLNYEKSGLANAADGQVWLFEGAPGDGAPVVDLVGYGHALSFEGSGPAPLHSTDKPPFGNQPLQSIERKAFRNSTAESMAVGGPEADLGNGSDTDDNATDFVVRPVRDPQSSLSPAEPVLPESAL